MCIVKPLDLSGELNMGNEKNSDKVNIPFSMMQAMIGCSIEDIRVFVGDDKNAALLLAVQQNKLEIVKCLMDSKSINTALLMAIENDKLEVVTCLVGQGANVNGSDVFSVSSNVLLPLHVAVAQGNLDIVKCLVKQGANVNKQNTRGQTALSVSQILQTTDTTENEITKYLKGLTNQKARTTEEQEKHLRGVAAKQAKSLKEKRNKQALNHILSAFIAGVSLYSLIDFKYLSLSMFKSAGLASMRLAGAIGAGCFAYDLYKICGSKNKASLFAAVMCKLLIAIGVALLLPIIAPAFVAGGSATLACTSVVSGTYAVASVFEAVCNKDSGKDNNDNQQPEPTN